MSFEFGSMLLLMFTIVIGPLIFKCFGTVKEYEKAVIFRFGKLVRVADAGIFFMIPMVENCIKVDTRTISQSVDKLESITQDNVPIKVNAVIFYSKTNPKNAVIKVENADVTTVQVSLTALRNIIGRHPLDQVLKDQERIVAEMNASINVITNAWGVTVSRVEMRSVELPDSMQRVMAQEAEAKREKLSRIIKAEAELEAAKKLKEAADLIMENPISLELRRMQMVTEVGAEQNTTTIILMPSEFVSMAGSIADFVKRNPK